MNHTTLSKQEATTQRIFRVVVAGGRRYADKAALYRWLDHFLRDRVAEGWTIVIIHGNCRRIDPETKAELPTADQLARQYAYDRGYDQVPFTAQWTKFGKRAGPLRNAEMAEYGHVLIAFWNKKSDGTKNMITLARLKGLPIRQVYSKY